MTVDRSIAFKAGTSHLKHIRGDSMGREVDASEPQMPVDSCRQFVETIASQCVANNVDLRNLPDNATNSVADGLAGLSVAISWGALVLAAVALAGAVGWGFIVRHWAAQEAEKAAKAKLDAELTRLCEAWLSKNVPKMFREYDKLASAASEQAASGAYNPDAIAENVEDENPS